MAMIYIVSPVVHCPNHPQTFHKLVKEVGHHLQAVVGKEYLDSCYQFLHTFGKELNHQYHFQRNPSCLQCKQTLIGNSIDLQCAKYN